MTTLSTKSMYLLLLFTSSIAYSQVATIVNSQESPNSTPMQLTLVSPSFEGLPSEVTVKAKPGVPKRRVGGGSR